MFELVSPGAHLWSLDVDGWRIPCRTELGCCSSGMSIESALKNVDARCVHYILWEVVNCCLYCLLKKITLFLI